MKAIPILCFLILYTSQAWATWDEWEDQPPIISPENIKQFKEMLNSRSGSRGGKDRIQQAPLLGPITPNAYGPGINSDATGRPFTYQPDFGGSGYPDPTLNVTPNSYGPGVGMDQYGRPVRPKSWP